MSFGFKKVVSLVIENASLYIIMTGNVGGLPKAFAHLGGGTAGESLGAAAATPIVKKFQDELAAGNKQLDEQGADACLSLHKKNVKIALADITSVDYKDKKQPELTIQSSQGKFSFVFSVHDVAQVSSFVASLQ